MGKSIPNLNSTKKGQIRTMFFTLKMLALFFSAIPLFQYFSNKFNINFNNNNYSVYAIGITLIVICTLMFFLMFIFNRNENNRFLQILEMSIFIIVFIIAIYVSGANESYNKFIFLFIIISYTIEYGMNTGLTIASVSTGVIILMDLVFDNKSNLNRYFENDLALFVMFYLAAWTLGFYVRLEKSHIKDLTEYANIDGLTGAYNHRYFYELIGSIYDESKKKNNPLSLLMVDIDYFKKYNDMFGHAKGDELLKKLTSILKTPLRATDILCRYGGDEFCVILPGTDKELAAVIANSLRESIYNFDCPGQEYLPHGKMTISVGVSTLNKDSEDFNSLIEDADIALYRAKFLRRNKVEVYSSVFDRVIEIDNKNSDLLENMKPLKTLITVINSRDTYTYKHVERVFNFCNIMANYLKLSTSEKKLLLYGAYLHDLGKINISKELLVADNKLTKEQWEELKKHPQDSADIIKQIDGFEEVIPIVLQHHEKYDGSGYPFGLKGDEISYLARVLTVVDSFDAMTNQRTYQKVKTFEEAFQEIENCKGTHFDPIIADQFIDAVKAL